MARISKEDQEIVKNKILEVSRRLFNEVGFDKASTKMIARETGIAEGTIFNYFSSKDEIFFEVFYIDHINDVDEGIYRHETDKDVIEEMKYCIEKYDPKELYFDDDNIDASHNWLSELMDLKIKEGIKIPFSCMGHVSIKPELLEKMKKAGLQAMKFGVESTNDEVLKRLGKGSTKELAIRTINKCKELGIKTHLTYCIGLPGDTEETVKKTVEFARTQGNHYQVSIAAPFPGTPLFKEAEENGWLNFKTWDDFDGMKDAIINYPHLSSKKLYEIYSKAQSYTYLKVLRDGEWVKYIRMIYQERGFAGLLKLVFVRGFGMVKEAISSKF